MNYHETMEYLQSLQKFGIRMGLHRMRALLLAMGNPQEHLSCIHIGGTNGKGSVCAMLTRVLMESDFRVGTYISPALHQFNERISLDNAPIPDADLVAIISELREHAEKLGADGDHPTEFELVTAAAFTYFYRAKAEVVVLEVGLGGRLDSTNIIDAPLLSVITNVGFDHMQILGHTLSEIAGEKAGIIKKGRPVVTGVEDPAVIAVLEQKAREAGTTLYVLGKDFAVERLLSDWSGQTIRADMLDSHYDEIAISLLGEHQAGNAALVLAVVDLLRREGLDIPDAAVQLGMRQAFWPGRLEVMRQAPVVVIDGAHNPAGMAALRKTLLELAPDTKIVLVLGILADKDWQGMVREAALFAQSFIAVQPKSPRALEAQLLGDYIESLGREVLVCSSVASGVRLAWERSAPEDVLCIAGSLVTAAEARWLFLDAAFPDSKI